jgi:MSHA pilin protein MshA
MRCRGFTLIELILVIVLLGVLATVAAPKFIDITDDAQLKTLLTMKGAIKSAETLVALDISLNPERLNSNRSRFTLDDGQVIRIRGNLPEGRWNNTFRYLVNFDSIEQVSRTGCNSSSATWCVTQRGQNWFRNRGYPGTVGRGFVIYPQGKDVVTDNCYVFYLNQNNTATPSSVLPSVVAHDFTDC